MKKLILIGIFTMAFVFCSMGDANAQITTIGTNNGKDKPKPTGQDIEILDLILSSGSPIRPRSAMSCVTATIYEDQIEMNFYYELGAVAVSIIDQSGQCVYRGYCDTELEPVTMLPIPLTEGMFKITIEGDLYRGEGSFNL